MGNIIELARYRHPAAVAPNEDIYRSLVIDALIALQQGNVAKATDDMHELLDELEDVIRWRGMGLQGSRQ